MGSAVFIEGVLFPNSCQIVVSSKLSPGQLMPPGGFVCLYFRGSVQFFFCFRNDSNEMVWQIEGNH